MMDVIAGLNCDDQLVIYTNIKLLYCTPETNITIMLYVNYISIFLKKERIYEDTWHNSGPSCAQLMLDIIIYIKYLTPFLAFSRNLIHQPLTLSFP